MVIKPLLYQRKPLPNNGLSMQSIACKAKLLSTSLSEDDNNARQVFDVLLRVAEKTLKKLVKFVNLFAKQEETTEENIFFADISSSGFKSETSVQNLKVLNQTAIAARDAEAIEQSVLL